MELLASELKHEYKRFSALLPYLSADFNPPGEFGATTDVYYLKDNSVLRNSAETT
jgi:hypothetical protein